MPANATAIPTIPNEIQRLVLQSENQFASNVDNAIAQLNALSAMLPRTYGWRFRTAGAFSTEMALISSTAKDCLPINSFYWRDQLGNWEAYSLMNTWRGIDLARSCVWALAREDSACACLLARAAIETAAMFVDTVRMVSATITGPTPGCELPPIVDPEIDLRRTAVMSTELEENSLQAIFASRLPDRNMLYDAPNILTSIKRISKIKTQEFVHRTYEILCEVSHPNMLGRTLYLHSLEPGKWEGNELRTLGPGNGPTWHSLVEQVVIGLSWSCATHVSAFALMAETIRLVIARIQAAEQAPSE